MKTSSPIIPSLFFKIRLIEIFSLFLAPILISLLILNDSGSKILLILGAIFLVTVISIKFKYGFFILVLSIFWGRSFVVETFIITFTDIVLVILMSFFIARFLVKGQKLRAIAFARPILAFLLVCCLSIFWADYKSASIKEIIQIIELYVLFNLICTNELNEDLIRKMGTIFISAVTVHSFLFFGDAFYQIGRFYGTMGAMTPYVTAFAVILIFSLLLFKGVPGRYTVFLYLAFAINSIALLLTQVRSAWIALITGILVISFLKNKKYSLLALAFMAIIFISFLTVPLLPSTITERIESFVDPNYPFNLTRLALLQNGFYAFTDSPILGIGIRNLGEVGLKFWENSSKLPPWSVDEIVKSKAGAHNLWLTLLAEVGIIGFLIYAWLIYSALKLSKIYFTSAETKWDKAIASFLVAFFIVFIVANNFTTFQAYTGGTIFLILFFNITTLLSRRLMRE